MNCLLKPALYPAVEICDLTCERNVGIVFFFSCNLWGISGKIYVQWVLLAKKVLIVIIQWWKVYADNILQKILKGLDILDSDIFKEVKYAKRIQSLHAAQVALMGYWKSSSCTREKLLQLCLTFFSFFSPHPLFFFLSFIFSSAHKMQRFELNPVIH